MKKTILLTFLLVLCCSGCGSSPSESSSQTGEQMLLSGAGQEELLSTGAVLEEGTAMGELEGGEEVIPVAIPTIHSRFSVPLCNTIVDLYECIIQNAPLENQPVMQASLDQVLEPRTMMADAQLREVCQEVIQQDTFQEVMQHYTSTGQNLGCSF